MSISSNLRASLQTWRQVPDVPALDALQKALTDTIRYEIERQPLELLRIDGDGKVSGPLAPAILKVVNDALQDFARQLNEAVPPGPPRQPTADELSTSRQIIERVQKSFAAAPNLNTEYRDINEMALATYGHDLFTSGTIKAGWAPAKPTLEPGDTWTIDPPLPVNPLTVSDAPLDNTEEYECGDEECDCHDRRLDIADICDQDESTDGARALDLAKVLTSFDSSVLQQRADALTEMAARGITLPPVLACQHDLTKPVATRHIITHTDGTIVTNCRSCGEIRLYTLRETHNAQ